MLSYTIPQWIFFFYIYCFIGWIIECTIVSLTEKKFVNRGFLRGPYLPLYGFGGIVILFASLPVKNNFFLVYLCGMVGTTILEYITGWLMESLLKMKYWDYSSQRFNYKGRISLTSSLFWGLLSLFMTYILHPFIEDFVFMIPQRTVVIISIILSCVFIADTINAIRTALDVNKLLANITRIRTEMEVLRIQLTEKVENSERTLKLKNKMQELKSELSFSFAKINFFNKQLIKAHPRAYSKYFNDALKEVRIKVNEKISKR